MADLNRQAGMTYLLANQNGYCHFTKLHPVGQYQGVLVDIGEDTLG